MNKWLSRFPNTIFHGGDKPDAADFKLYSWIYKYMHTFTMKNLMTGRGK